MMPSLAKTDPARNLAIEPVCDEGLLRAPIVQKLHRTGRPPRHAVPETRPLEGLSPRRRTSDAEPHCRPRLLTPTCAPPESGPRCASTAGSSALGGLNLGARSTTGTLRRVTLDSLMCLDCGLTSHRPNDVTDGYCSARTRTGRGAATGLVEPQLQPRGPKLAWRTREQDGHPHRDVCPPCAAGAHDNCDGHAWCEVIDVGIDCTCALEDHPPV
jgi:hypothetical protein